MKMKKKLVLLFIFFNCSYLADAQNSYTDSLKQQLSSSTEDTNKVILLGLLSSEYIWSFADTGKIFAEEGLQLSKKLNFKSGEAMCSLNLCICLSQQGDFTRAFDLGFKALSIFENIGDIEKIRGSHTILMICYRDQGDYKQALIQGYKAKQILHMSRFDSLVVLGNISSAYEKSNQLDSALFYGLRVYKIDEQWTGELITLGNIYSKMGKQETALDYYKKGINSTTLSYTNWSLMDIWLGMSKAFELKGEIDSSIDNAKKSFLSGKAIGNPRGNS